MSTLNRLAMLFTIAVVIKSGRIPTARAMTLPQLEIRQDLPTVAPPPAVTSAVVASPTTVAAVSSAVVSSFISSAAVTSAQAAETASSIAPTTSTVITSTIPATSSMPASTLSSAVLSGSANTSSGSVSGSTTSSAPSSSSTPFSEELSSPLPKPNYAPGGMAFILPAFIVIGLIFIIWLIYKTKEYIWKLKEAEELADVQSPDPAKPAPGGKGVKAKDKGQNGGGAGKIGGGWKKKGWKELDSEEDERWERRDRDRDRYSRVGEWQGSRKYRSRDRGEAKRYDPYERSRGGYGASRESWDDRDKDRRYRGDERGGYGRVREREEEDDMVVFDMYDRREREPVPVDRRQSRRSDREDRGPVPPAHDRPSPPRSRAPAQDKPRPPPDNPNLSTIPIPQSAVTPDVQASVQAPATALGPVSHPPSRPSSASATLSPPISGQVLQRGMSRKEKKDRAEEWIKREKEWNEGRHHEVERREIARDQQEGKGKGKGKVPVPDAYEDEFEGRYTNHLSLGAIPQSTGEGGKGLDVKIGQAGYVPVNQVGISAAVNPLNPKPSEMVSSPKDRSVTTAVISSHAPRQNPIPTSQPHSPPAYMRARAISPPPILSPPMNPNLFFHVGPSTTELVPLSTYDSATDLDLESIMTPMPSSRHGPDGEARREKEHMRMPSIPSTAEKLERSGTAGPGRTVRKIGTPTNSRVIGSGLERTPTRTKSHDTSSPRGDIHRTPTRRGTDTVANRVTPTIRLVDSRGGSLRRNNTTDSTGTPQPSGKRSTTEGLTPKRYSKRVHPAVAGAGTPESTRKFRAQRKDQKARGKVDEILRDSWSERAVVSPVGMDMDDEEEEVGDNEGGVGQGNVPRDEVELAHARSRATSPTPAHRSPPPPTRPLSPRKAPPQGITSGGESVQDVAMLQGIEQRMALMKELENRARKAAERQAAS